MTQSVSASVGTDHRGELVPVRHNGLASGGTVYRGAVMMMSGTYAQLASGSLTTWTPVGVATYVNPQLEGTVATANGDLAGQFVISSGEFLLKNGNYQEATAVHNLAAGDAFKPHDIIDGQHIAKSGSSIGQSAAPQIMVLEPKAPTDTSYFWVYINPRDRT